MCHMIRFVLIEFRSLNDAQELVPGNSELAKILPNEFKESEYTNDL